MHCRVKKYLQIEQDVTINFECAFFDNNSLNLSKSTSAPPTKAGLKEAGPSDKRLNVIDEKNNNSLYLRKDTAAKPAKAGSYEVDLADKGSDAIDDNNQHNILSRRDKLDIFLQTEFPRSHSLSQWNWACSSARWTKR